ncbi:MAG: glycosyltransferase [Prosthecobacter sp.]
MRLLIIGNNSGTGGAQTAFRKLCEFLCNEGHEVFVIALQSQNSSFPISATHTSIKIDAESTSLIAKFRKCLKLIGAGRQARRFAPDVFIAVGLAKSASFIASRLSNKTFSVAQDFIHGRLIDDPLLVGTLTSFDALAVQSPAMVPALQNQTTEILPLNWLPCFPQSPIAGALYDPPPADSGVKLAYFGRLAANKGLPMLIEAFVAVLLANDTILHIWGEGEIGEELCHLIGAHDMQNRVRLMGRYPSGEEGAQLMCSYHALILPSTGSEGLPLILLEAMAYGIPFIATDVGAIRDCCEGNMDCILVQPEPKALASALVEMVRRIQSAHIKPDRLRSWYEAHFSTTMMSSRWRRFLDNPSMFFRNA